MEDIMRTIYSLEQPFLMKLIKGVSETTENESKILSILLGTWNANLLWNRLPIYGGDAGLSKLVTKQL